MYRIMIALLAICLISIGYVQLSEAEIVEDGLIGYWSFDNATDKTVKDGLGKHDGTIAEGTIKPDNGGKIGKALEFAGEPDFVEIEGANDFIANEDFTWCAWIKTKEAVGVVVAKSPTKFDTDAQGAKTFFLQNGALTFDTGHVGVLRGIELVNDDSWHYVAVSAEFDGVNADLVFYVDGKADAEGPMAVGKFPEEDFPLLIGLDPRVFGEVHPISIAFTGLIDEVSVYDRVLTEREVDQNFNSEQGLAVDAAGKLAATWADIKSAR